ncbi:MFS transporter [Roseibium sp.]|uniref:MFS transporter n=1 Tax=Roseibium sp. TaxID=1936156 RepID=UPI003A98433C
MAVQRITGLLVLNIFMSGAAYAAMNPYRAIVGIETLGFSNASFGALMACNALGGSIIAVMLGWISDKVEDRRVLVLLCAIGGILGFGLVWAVRTPIGFATAFCLLIPFGNALFSQSFSYSRAFYDRERPEKSQLILSFLRTAFTLAWIIVPPLAGWFAAKTSTYSVFGISAFAHVGCTLAVALLWIDSRSRIGINRGTKSDEGQSVLERPRIALGHRFGVVGVTFSMIALQLNTVLLPLIILKDLGGTLEQVGVTAAVAAAIEAPIMIGWGYLALRWRKETILAISCFLFAIYFGGVSLAGTYQLVLGLQVLAALAIAALISISISYLQEAIPGRVGLSTSLVDVTRVIASLSAAAIFAANPWATYGPLMGVAAVLCLGGTGALILAGRLALRYEA